MGLSWTPWQFRSGRTGRRADWNCRLLTEILEKRLVPSGILEPGSYDPSTVLVRFRTDAAGAAAAQVLPGAVLKPETDLVPGLDKVELPPGEGVTDALARYRASPLVQYAEPNYFVHAADVPNDTFFNSLWGLQNTGQSVGGQTGIPGDDIHAVDAWQRITGTTTVPVADIDSGIDYTHPDLYENIWINQAEIPASRRQNLVDVDGDGLITFWDLQDPRNQGPGKIIGRNPGRVDAQDILAPMVLDSHGNDTGMGGWAYPGNTQDGDTAHPNDFVGWNFVAGNNLPLDDYSHGSHTAGILGAVGNNNLGVTGVLWKAQIASLKFLDSHGNGTDADAILAINYAVRHQLPISNNSWGGGDFSQAVLDALTAARNAGHIFVAAAGNYGENTDLTPFYPADYHVNNIISVAATDNRDQLASFSDYGATSVHLAAPGVNVYSTVPGGLYSYKSGTSMSTPYVTGVVAMVEALRPRWSFFQVINQVFATVDPVPLLAGKTSTGGRLDAARAVAVGATHFGVTASAQATAGTAIAVTVRALDSTGATDASYTGTVHFTATDGQAALPANYAFTAADNGVHTFMLTLRTAGSQTVTVADTSLAAISGTTAVMVSPAAASSLDVRLPATSMAGTAFDGTVAVLDPYHNVVPTYRGTVRFGSDDGQATLPSTYTFTVADNGVHTFAGGVTLRAAGSHTVTATDTGTGLNGSGSVLVNPAAASRLEITAPTTATAGAAFSVTLAARDAFGNLATGYRGTVGFSSSDPEASLPAGYTFSAADGGQHTFQGGVILRTAGSRTVTATDAVSTLTISSSLTVGSAAASRLDVSIPSSATAGLTFDITVAARDPFGNLATTYRGAVRFGSNDPQATLPGGYTFTAADGGLHTFPGGVTLRTAGGRSLIASDSTAGINGSGTITVNPAAASRLEVRLPAAATAGIPVDVTVAARDPFGNLATTYRGTVGFGSDDTQARLPSNYAFTADDAGLHTFPSGATLRTAGNRTVTARDTAAGLNGSASLPVGAAAASRLEISIPAGSTAGTAFDITLTARDPYNNLATAYRGTVSFTSSDGQATLPPDYAFTAADGGVHTFARGVTLRTAGSRGMTARDTANGLMISANVVVGPAAATRFDVSAPSGSTAGMTFDLTLTARDPYNNLATAYRGMVSFGSDDSQTTLPPDYSFTAADAGTHTFARGVTLRTAGGQNVTATDVSAGSITGSVAVAVVAAPADHFAVGTRAKARPGKPFDVTVIALDPYGNIDTGYTGTVTFAGSDPDARVVLPADYTFTTDDAGLVVFAKAAVLFTPGDQTITATDTVTGITGSATIRVSHRVPLVGSGGRAFTALRPTAAPVAGDVHVASSEALAASVDSRFEWSWPGDGLPSRGRSTAEDEALAFLADLFDLWFDHDMGARDWETRA
jgi:subtilisin family serine protease